MRTATAPEQAILSGRVSVQDFKLEIKDAGGSWIDYSSFVNLDWRDRCEIRIDVNQRIAEATVALAREADGDSLAPLMNTEIKAGRAIRISGSRVAVGAAYVQKEMFLGVIDRVDWDANPMLLVARDDSGKLVDRWVRDETDYGTEAGRAIESVMQDLINDWADGAFTLYTPSSPGFLITPYRQIKQPVMEALQVLADMIGWVLEYRWDNGTGAFRLTFYEPDRTPAGTSWTFGPNDYYNVDRMSEDSADVRNRITVRYTDAVTGERTFYEVEDPTSIAEYDLQWAEFEESDDSPIDSAAEAAVMGNAALSDLAWPVADQEIEVDLFWPVQLDDFYEFLANGVHYGADQEFGVVGYVHVWENGKAITRITTRGTPVGHTEGWLKREGKPRPPAEVVRSTEILNFREVSRTVTTIKYAWTLGSDLALSVIHDYQEAQPYSVDKWPADDRLPESIRPERDVEYTVIIPEQGWVGYLQVEGRRADGSKGDMERALTFPSNVAGDYIAFAAVTVDQTDGSVVISGWTTDRALSVAYAYNVGAASAIDPPTQVQAEAQGAGATGGGLVTGFTSDFEVTLPAGTVDPGEVIKGLLIAYMNVNGTGPDGTAQDHDTPVGFQGERFKITLPDQLATGVVIANKLTESSKRFGSDLVFSATDWDTVAWTSGTITMADLTTYAIAAGNTGNLASNARRYIYLDPAVSTTVLQITTAIATATGENKVLVCEVARAVGGLASGQGAHYVPVVGAFFLNADQISAAAITDIKVATDAITTTKIANDAITTPKILAGQITAAKIAALTITAAEIAANTITASKIAAGTITASEIAANTITAAKMNVASLSAISADVGTLTAGVIRNGTSTLVINLGASGSSPVFLLYNGGNYSIEMLANGTTRFYGPDGSSYTSLINGGIALTDNQVAFGNIYMNGNDLVIENGVNNCLMAAPTKFTNYVGFYSTNPIAQQTGVAVSDAAIHAAMVNLGLFTA